MCWTGVEGLDILVWERWAWLLRREVLGGRSASEGSEMVVEKEVFVL